MALTRSKRTVSTVTKVVTQNGKETRQRKRVKVEVTALVDGKADDQAVESPVTTALPAVNDETAMNALEDEIHESEHKAEEEGVLLHPPLTFSYEQAKKHLINVDGRFKPLMDAFVCKPFEGEQVEAFNPFRNLAVSILGQQISWLAARSVTHKFVRSFHPHLPEKLEQGQSTPVALFPTPAQICELKDPFPLMRAAGLSQRKAEYILELAQRFHDGRLDARKLWGMSDDEVKKTLIECRGIGPWTIDMFSIFSLKRPDILAPGDLGIQKNLAKWYAADPESGIQIAPLARKLAASPSKASTGSKTGPPSTPVRASAAAAAAYPTPSSPSPAIAEDPPTATIGGDFKFPPTSNGLTPATLRARLSGKKIKGNYLTPQEMEELMEPWRPFRSVASWYLWQMSDLQDE